jgi:copper homeostasis protein (lipoprotein)
MRATIARLVPALGAAWIGIAGLAGCDGSGGQDGIGKVTGQAQYRDDVSVPVGTRLEVTVADVTAAPPPGQLLTRIVVAKAGQPPYEFEVPFRRDDVFEDHRYVVTARLMDRENVLFETAAPTPVITQGHPVDVDLVLQRADDEPHAVLQGPAPLSGLPATFTGTLPCADCPGVDYHVDFFGDETVHLRGRYRQGDGDRVSDDASFDALGRWVWQRDRGTLLLRGGRDGPMRFEPVGDEALRLVDIDGERVDADVDPVLERADSFDPITPELRMRGMYSYMADAARFTECRTGRTMPVAQEGANAALERGYLEAASESGADAGAELLAEITGRIARRMPMEGDRPVATVVPLAFHAVRPGETCGTPFSDAEPVGTYWKLMRLAETALLPIAEAREPHIVLNAEGRLGGSDGCNRLTGEWSIDGRRIEFTQIAQTKMACPQGAEQAEQFRAALDRAESYRIDGSHLALYNAESELLARFEAIYDE